MSILEVKNVRKVYGGTGGKVLVEALSKVNFSVERYSIHWLKDINILQENQLASFRREKLGFVFQDFNLLDNFTNRDNIYLPCRQVFSQKTP